LIYLYAYTNFKDGLDSLRRVAALYWELQKESIDCELLVNDYRAQLLARSWGLPLATTIETIKDIDAVATPEDIVVIDSPESIEGKVLGYGEYFKKVIYLKSTPQSLPNAESWLHPDAGRLETPHVQKCGCTVVNTLSKDEWVYKKTRPWLSKMCYGQKRSLHSDLSRLKTVRH